MKKIALLITALGLLLSGCAIEKEPVSDVEYSVANGIIARATKIENITNEKIVGDATEKIVFSENDILRFYESTKEIRFKDNVAMRATLAKEQALKFYLSNEYLFSAFVYVNSPANQTFKGLVLYYNTVENKFYLLDGYPPTVTESRPSSVEDLINNNMKDVEKEWNMFINHLKKENKYTN